MNALLLKSLCACLSTCAVLLFITALPYLVLGFAIYHGGRNALLKATADEDQVIPAANNSHLLAQGH